MRNETMLANILSQSVSKAKQLSKQSRYKHLYATTMEYLLDIEKQLDGKICSTDKAMEDVQALGMFNVRVLYDYDPKYSAMISRLVHILMAKFNMLNDQDIKNNRENGLYNINKALLEYQIARSENIKPKFYTEPLSNLETMKSLLNNEEWPEPTFPESTALTKFITDNKNDLNEVLVKATQKAVENFDEYYDYLDPSYRQN